MGAQGDLQYTKEKALTVEEEGEGVVKVSLEFTESSAPPPVSPSQLPTRIPTPHAPFSVVNSLDLEGRFDSFRRGSLPLESYVSTGRWSDQTTDMQQPVQPQSQSQPQNQLQPKANRTEPPVSETVDGRLMAHFTKAEQHRKDSILREDYKASRGIAQALGRPSYETPASALLGSPALLSERSAFFQPSSAVRAVVVGDGARRRQALEDASDTTVKVSVIITSLVPRSAPLDLLRLHAHLPLLSICLVYLIICSLSLFLCQSTPVYVFAQPQPCSEFSGIRRSREDATSN
jgi:hypothetical protein